MKLKKLQYCLLLIAYCFSSQAQIYPVQINTALNPPYETTISNYATTLNEKFVANLFTSDLTISQRQVQLKLYIEGNNIQATSTPIINGYEPLYLNGGESLRLTNVDLTAYFRLENLQGINPNVYGNSLPQGLYKFCIEVYDYNTQIKISQKSCAMSYFIVNDPPFLNLPTNHENIPSQDPTNIVFSWTPRHFNATNIEYEYTLVDLQDNQAPSNYTFLLSPPLYHTITNNTILLYGATEPLLTPGKKYAWRVQARTQSGFGDTAAFKNNGYSEIYDFVFQGNCDKPAFLTAEALTNSQVKIKWLTNPNHLNYIIQYRKKNSTIWFETQSTTSEVKLYDLEPLEVYEYRVGGYCIGNVLSFSNINEFTQPSSNVNAMNCGISPTVDLSNQQLYNSNLGEGEVFIAGDFPVHVTESTNSSGSYSGKGWTKAPYLNSIRLAVIFTDIKLNTDKKLIKGEVRAVYDPTWSNIADINVMIDQVENVLDLFQASNDVHTYTVNFPILNVSNITLVNGQIIIVNPDTNQTGATYDHDNGEMTTITDSNGSVYTVSPTGQIQQVGVGIGIPTPTNTENVAANGSVTALSNVGIKVTFKKSDISGKESIAAEDKGVTTSAPAKIKALYKTIKDGQNNDYPLYYKAIINKEDGNPSYEYVIAEIKITDSNVKIDNLIFNKKGVKVETENLPNQGTTIRRLLKVPAFTTVGEEQVLALLKNGTQKQKVVGAMVAVPIKDVGIVNVTLIPVNGATITTATQTQLNAIYAGTGVTLNTTTAPNYTTTKTTLDCGASGFFANYTSDQKAFINDYKAANPAQSDQYYIFVTKNISPTGRQLNGFMPLHRQFGFVFSDQTTGNEVKNDDVSGLASVIAHELGHGAFELEHPWEKYKYSQGSGSTPWLMDYTKGTQIPFSDWQTISHPKDKLYIFQGDESGASFENVPKSEGESVSYKLDNPMIFVSLGGKAIKLPKDAIVKFYCVDENSTQSNGLLIGFKIDGIQYIAKSSELENPNSVFTGYYKIVNNKYISEKYTNSISLSVGTNYPINYLHIENNESDSQRIKIIEINKILSQQGHELPNGNFGGKRLNSNNTLLDYAQGTVVAADRTFSYTSACTNTATNSASRYTYIEYKNNGDTINLSSTTKATFDKFFNALSQTFAKEIKLIVYAQGSTKKGEADAAYAQQISQNKSAIEIEVNATGTITKAVFNIESIIGVGNTCIANLVNTKILAKIQSDPTIVINGYDLLYRIYYTMQASVECLLGEQTNQNSYVAGFLYEFLQTLDIPQLVIGLKDLGVGIAKYYLVDSPLGFLQQFKKIIIVAKKIAANQQVTQRELIEALINPAAISLYEKAKITATGLYGVFITNGNPWRYGRLTMMAIPLVLTLGEYSAVIAGRLGIEATQFAKICNTLNKATNVGFEIAAFGAGKILKPFVKGTSIIEKVDNIVPNNLDEVAALSNDAIATETIIANVVEDAEQLSKRVVVLGSDEVSKVQQYLGAINNVGDNVYLVVHGSGETFSVIRNGLPNLEMNHRALATWLTKKGLQNKNIVLLSCSDLTSAQNLANKLGGTSKVTAWEGAVTVFENGTIKGEGICKEFSPNNINRVVPDIEIPKGTNVGETGNNVKLGVGGVSSILYKLDNILAKPGFNGINGLFNKLKALETTPRRTLDYASLQSFRDKFINLHGLTTSGIKNIDGVLDDFDFLITNHSAVPNVEKYLDELMQSINKFKGGAFGLEILSDLPPSLQGKILTKFEASIDDIDGLAGGCRFDLQFSDGSKLVYIETKNYAQTTAFTNSFYNQFKAYISNSSVTSIDDIKYLFKINNGVTKAERVQKFKNMLLNGNKYDEIYTLNPAIFETLGIESKMELKQILEIAQNESHPLFNFIELF